MMAFAIVVAPVTVFIAPFLAMIIITMWMVVSFLEVSV